MSKNEDKRQLKCSFCGKNQEQVKRLIAGPNVYICDECVELCDEIIQEEIDEVVEGKKPMFDSYIDEEINKAKTEFNNFTEQEKVAEE